MTGDETIHTIPAGDASALSFRRYDPAAGPRRGSLVYLHGIQSHGGWYRDTAAELARRGYAVYLTDRRGSGLNRQPRGHFENREQLVDDVRRFVELAADEGGGSPVFLVGGCWGARPAVTFAVQQPDAIAGLALICPALKAKVDLSPREKVRVLAGVARRNATVPIPLSPELFTRQPEWLEFIRNDPLALREVRTSFFLKQALWDRWILRQSSLRLPMLLLQSGRDEIVDVPAVTAWFERQPSPEKRLLLYPEFDHLLDFEPDRQRYWDDLVGWLDGLASQPASEQRTVNA
jgi:acylglycerol lipase